MRLLNAVYPQRAASLSYMNLVIDDGKYDESEMKCVQASIRVLRARDIALNAIQASLRLP